MQDILGRLMEYGIHAEKKYICHTEVLRSFGMDIHFKRHQGYYLAGQTAPGELLTGHCRYLRVKLLQKKLQSRFDLLRLVQDTETEDEAKPVKLSCRNSRKTEVMNTLGEFAQYREKEDNTFVAIVQVKDNPKVFWVALQEWAGTW